MGLLIVCVVRLLVKACKMSQGNIIQAILAYVSQCVF